MHEHYKTFKSKNAYSTGNCNSRYLGGPPSSRPSPIPSNHKQTINMQGKHLPPPNLRLSGLFPILRDSKTPQKCTVVLTEHPAYCKMLS